MPTLMIRNIPAPVHRRLREAATRARRSMNQEAILLLQAGLSETRDLPAVVPFRGAKPLTVRLVSAAIREGRS